MLEYSLNKHLYSKFFITLFFKYSAFQILYYTQISKTSTYREELKPKYKLTQKEKKKISESKPDCPA